MADVVVDQKPMAKLPYDPDMIPDAVKRRVAAVEALYGTAPAAVPAETPAETPAATPPAPPSPSEHSNGSQPQQSAAVESASEQLDLPLAEPTTQAPGSHQPPPHPASADHRPPPSEDENSETWKSRYMGLQGRYTGSQKKIGELEEQITQMGQELLQTQQWVSRQSRAAPPPPQSYVTEKDVQEYGSDLVDFTQRAAVQAVAPHLQALEQQNTELQRRLAQEARARLDMRVEAAVPNYREIDEDPRWRRWLLGIDLLSGRVRQQLLNEAIASANAPRVISFFNGFLAEEAATGHSEPAPSSRSFREPAIHLSSLAAPGRARPATGGDALMPSDRPTYTRAQIKQLYEQHRRGAYVGREAEWARQDADIIAAGKEGRVQM
jgi:hypothetical protein